MSELVNELRLQFEADSNSRVIIFVNERKIAARVADYLNSEQVPDVLRRCSADSIISWSFSFVHSYIMIAGQTRSPPIENQFEFEQWRSGIQRANCDRLKNFEQGAFWILWNRFINQASSAFSSRRMLSPKDWT